MGSSLTFLFFLFFFWPCHTACGILVPRPGIEPASSALKAWSPNHWTAREVPPLLFKEAEARVEMGTESVPGSDCMVVVPSESPRDPEIHPIGPHEPFSNSQKSPKVTIYPIAIPRLQSNLNRASLPKTGIQSA